MKQQIKQSIQSSMRQTRQYIPYQNSPWKLTQVNLYLYMLYLRFSHNTIIIQQDILKTSRQAQLASNATKSLVIHVKYKTANQRNKLPKYNIIQHKLIISTRLNIYKRKWTRNNRRILLFQNLLYHTASHDAVRIKRSCLSFNPRSSGSPPDKFQVYHVNG